MRKLLLIFSVLLISLVCSSQSIAHMGFGNTYTYSDNDGINESDFFACGMGNDGRVFFHAHAGALYIKGNNYVKKIKFPPDAIPLHIWMMSEQTPGHYLAFGDVQYYLINDDSIVRSYNYPLKSFHVFKWKGGIIGASSDKASEIYLLKNDSFICNYSIPSKNGVARLFVDSLENVWQIDYQGKNANFYKIFSFSKLQFQFSILTERRSDLSAPLKLRSPMPLTLIPIESYSNDPYSVPTESQPISQRFIVSNLGNHLYELRDKYRVNKKQNILYEEKIMYRNLYDSFSRSFYFGSFNKPFHYFPYILKYPKVFNNTSSSSIHTIVQDSLGRIWAGSYEDGLSIIDPDKVISKQERNLAFLPGAFSTKKKIYLNTEKENGGFLQYDLGGHWKKVKTNSHFISTFVNKKTGQFYLGSTNRGLWYSDVNSLESANPAWKIIDSSKGNYLINSISSITEDKIGRIWMGGRLRGFAVYYPGKDIAKTWLISKGETSFGFWSSYTDDRGTVWLGTDNNGLMFYNSYSGDGIHLQEIKRILHPLLPEGTKVMQLAQWNNWLIIGTATDILLLDLEQWYKNKKVLIRYLNSEERSFTSTLQQNAILVDNRDSSIWFATGDMLYQWDIREWLSLPTYVIKPNIALHNLSGDSVLTQNRLMEISPTNNTLSFSVWFQSKDNMPRYMSVALVKHGDSAIFSQRSFQTQFQYANLASGSYQFVVRILESDGTLSIHKYPFIIKKFWWQNWWAWLVLFMIFFLPILLWIIDRTKARLAKEKLKRKEAELETFKSEQKKKLASYKVISLSNQFRPHFILNALNTVGAELDDKPQAETVLSRLGESIDLIFNHAHQQKITHSLVDEWKLVKNVIEIHRLMYLKDLKANLPDERTIEHYKEVMMPLGLLQLPVENSLLHGLCNKDEGPWNLVIEIIENENELTVSIQDDGIGRAKAATLSNYRNHGTGIKNLNSILEIVNAGNEKKIAIRYEDNVFINENSFYGTKVIITIPKIFDYEI